MSTPESPYTWHHLTSYKNKALVPISIMVVFMKIYTKGFMVYPNQGAYLMTNYSNTWPSMAVEICHINLACEHTTPGTNFELVVYDFGVKYLTQPYSVQLKRFIRRTIHSHIILGGTHICVGVTLKWYYVC